MHPHFNPYSITLMISAAAALLVGLVLFRRKHSSIFLFALMMHVSAIWAGAYAFELSSSTLDEMLFWIKLEYIGVAYLPALWILFVIHFIGKKDLLSAPKQAAIFIIPTLTLLLVWTNSYHHLHYRSTGIDLSGPFPLLAIETGPWYLIHTIFFYLLMALGMLLMVRHFIRSDKLYRRQTVVILIGTFVPWITNLLYLLGLRPYSHIDLTPYAFILTALIIAFGLMRYRLFDIVPFAREKLIEDLREGMLVLDEQRRIIDLNSTVQKFLGKYSPELIGKRIDEVLPSQIGIQHLLLREGHNRVEISLDSDSGIHEYELSATRLQNDRKQFIGTLLVFWDITNRKKTTELLLRQTRELSDLNNLKNRLFSIIAHDLKGPLAGMKGMLELTQAGDVSPEEFKSLLPLLSTNVDNTRMLLDNLLQWAKSQLEGERIQPELFDLKLLTVRNIRLSEKRGIEKGIKLIDDCFSGTLLYADKDMIDLVMRNLIGNAIKFCDEGDVIKVRALVEGGFTTVQISDTGKGIDEQTMANLFQLLPAGKAGTRHEMGTGLGLKLCKDFIEKNNGTIWAESQAGHGSTFYFRLPNNKDSGTIRLV